MDCACTFGGLSPQAIRAAEAALHSVSAAANGPIDELIDWHGPQDYRDELERLKVSADLLNQTAWNEPGWGDFYGEILRFYTTHKDDSVWTAPWNFGSGQWNAIQDRKKRVAEWAAQIRQKGGIVREPDHEERETGVLASLGLDSKTLLVGLAALAAVVILKVV